MFFLCQEKHFQVAIFFLEFGSDFPGLLLIMVIRMLIRVNQRSCKILCDLNTRLRLEELGSQPNFGCVEFHEKKRIMKFTLCGWQVGGLF